MEEPTDEMLSTIMKEAAEDARKRGEEAQPLFRKANGKLIKQQTTDIPLWAKEILLLKRAQLFKN